MLTFDEATHTYRVDGLVVPSVTQILQPLSDFSMVSPALLEAAQHFGTAVHRATELDDAGQLDHADLDPALLPYLEAWDAFSREWSVEWEGREERVFHPQLRYCGTLDARGTLRQPGTEHRRAAVVDIKTSTAIYPSVGPQLAAYARALEHSAPGVSPSPMRLAVQLCADGTYVAKEFRSPGDFALFSSLLTIRNWAAQHGITPRF